MTLSDRSMCMIPCQGIGSSLFSLFLIRLFGGVQGKGWSGSMLVPHILQSQKPDPIEKTGHTIRSRCACVEFSGWNSHLFLHDSIFYFEIWAIFLFSFFFLFPFPMLLGTDTFFLFLSHSSYSFCNMKSHVKMIRVFLCGWKAYFCATSSVEVGTSICGVFVILILKAWNKSHKGHK